MRKKKQDSKRWWTIAYLTREGGVHPAHPYVARVYKSEVMLLEDLVYAMTHELGHRGAYVAGVWKGELTETDCLRGSQKPAFYVFQGGEVERF